MPLPHTLLEALGRHAATVLPEAPLAKRCWWRVGGSADVLAEVGSAESLAYLLAAAADTDVPVTVLGNGSNVLIADGGVQGLLIRLTGAHKASDITGDTLYAGAGLANTVLLARLAKAGRSGLAALAGVPGTIGGAVVMNAGQSLGSFGPALSSVTIATREGTLQTLAPDALHFAYRHSELPEGSVVVGVTATLGTDTSEPERLATFLAHRKATQPLDKPSVGSTFTNPPGEAAGRLIEQTGLKGFRLGRAYVSDKHANFVINEGEATAWELASLVSEVSDRVFDATGIRLHPEVRLLGRWGDVDPHATRAWRS